MIKRATITENDILAEVVAPRKADLTAAAARGLLALKFDRQTTQKIRNLLRQNNAGTISAADRLTLEKYLRVGQLLDLLHAKARLTLGKKGVPA
jgi:hypothetical protein